MTLTKKIFLISVVFLISAGYTSLMFIFYTCELLPKLIPLVIGLQSVVVLLISSETERFTCTIQLDKNSLIITDLMNNIYQIKKIKIEMQPEIIIQCAEPQIIINDLNIQLPSRIKKIEIKLTVSKNGKKEKTYSCKTHNPHYEPSLNKIKLWKQKMCTKIENVL